jgi:hypothetical protein
VFVSYILIYFPWVSTEAAGKKHSTTQKENGTFVAPPPATLDTTAAKGIY